MLNRPDSSINPLSTSPPVQSPNVQPIVEKPKFRHEWFQTATHVTVEVFVKGRKKDQVKVQFQSRNIDVSIALDGGSEYNLNLDLADEIDLEGCKYEVLSTKIEIKLKKSRSAKWETLEASADPSAKLVKQWDSVEDKSAPKATMYPSSSRAAAKTGRDWDKLAKESGGDEEEKLEGDAALNKVFAGIYKNASDEQRKAMLKSFQESGGTVLSTNWEDVGKGPVKGSPPNGMEMKQWKDLDH
jgi:suppressor of G2 allele of SKP1